MMSDDRSKETDELAETPADPESARILEADARDRLAAMGIDQDDGLVLAKEYVAAEPGGDVEDFLEFVRRRRERA
jgi:hypothetical protein